jgi:hypothetical protein
VRRRRSGAIEDGGDGVEDAAVGEQHGAPVGIATAAIGPSHRPAAMSLLVSTTRLVSISGWWYIAAR